MNMTSPTRRTFIRQAACAALTTTGILNTIFDLRRLSAAPLDASDYKALICLFLFGGNDANNVIVPHGASGYASYAAARGILAIPQASLLPLTLQNGDGRDFGFHPNLVELQTLFNQGKLGLVSNVGTLVGPVTRAQYLAGGAAVPPQLFSHADQSVQWQTSVPDVISKTGWGGRMADMLQSLNAGSRSIAANDLLTTPLAGIPAFQTVFPNSNLGSQLNMIAKMIAARNNLSMKRQIFFCSVGGYDTHGDQLTGQANLLTELSQGLSAFYNATVELGVASQVTTFTASDFGRTYPTNGSGSDHGWGSHQFVLGGAVQGGRLFGTFPTLAVNGPDDTGQGRWIPTTSVDEFSATLATWFGVSVSDLPAVLPNIGRFAHPNIGIFG